MSPELRDLLQKAAVDAAPTTDVDAIRRRALRIRRGRRIRHAVAAVAVVALAVPAVDVARSVLAPDVELGIIDQPVPRDTAAPADLTVIEGLTDLRLVAGRLYGRSVHGVVVSDDGGATWRVVVETSAPRERVLAFDVGADGAGMAILDVVDGPGSVVLRVAERTADGTAWTRGEHVLAVNAVVDGHPAEVEVHRTREALYVTRHGADPEGNVGADVHRWVDRVDGFDHIAFVLGARRFAFGPSGYGAATGLDGVGVARRTLDGGSTWEEIAIDDAQFGPVSVTAPVIGGGTHTAFAILSGGAPEGESPVRLLEFDAELDAGPVPRGPDLAEAGLGPVLVAPVGAARWVVAHTTAEGTRVVAPDGSTADLPPLADLVGDGSTLYAVTESAAIDRTDVLRSGDGGSTWEVVASRVLGGGEPDPAPEAAGPLQQGVTPSGFVWSLRVTGLFDERNAQPLPLPAGLDPEAVGTVHFADRQTGWVLAGGAEGGGPAGASLYATTDGGATWAQHTVAWQDGPPDIPWQHAEVQVVDDQEGAGPGALLLSVERGEVTESGGDPGRWLARSRDGGATWTFLGQSPGSRAVTFSAPDIGWSIEVAVDGADDRFWRTDDAGRSWDEVALEPAPDEVEVDLLDVTFHESSADLVALHRHADGSAQVALYEFGTPWTWTSVALPDGVSLDVEDPYRLDLHTLSLGAAWWIVTGPGTPPITVTRDRLAAWDRVVLPYGRWFDGGDEVVAAYDPACACTLQFVSEDAHTWEPRAGG